MDFFKILQGERSGPTFNLRKAGEGSEIDPKWKKTYAYKKEKESHEDDDDEVSSVNFDAVLMRADLSEAPGVECDLPSVRI